MNLPLEKNSVAPLIVSIPYAYVRDLSASSYQSFVKDMGNFYLS